MSHPTDPIAQTTTPTALSDAQLADVAGAGWFDAFVDWIKPADLRIVRKLR